MGFESSEPQEKVNIGELVQELRSRLGAGPDGSSPAEADVRALVKNSFDHITEAQQERVITAFLSGEAAAEAEADHLADPDT